MRMAKLITEYSQDFEITEENHGKDMYAVGIFSSAELKNNNKRRYRKDILEREVGKVQEKIEKKCLWGELGHPPNPEVNPDKIALRTVKLEWKGNNLYGKAKILDTPMGQIAKTLIKEGAMGISSRGLGTVGDDGYVNEDFHLITWDLVTDPSNKPSWVNGIYEGQEFNIPGTDLKKDPTDEDVRKAQKAHYNQLLRFIDELNESKLNERVRLPEPKFPNKGDLGHQPDVIGHLYNIYYTAYEAMELYKDKPVLCWQYIDSISTHLKMMKNTDDYKSLRKR